MDRLYNTEQAGEIIGITGREVVLHIRAGNIAAVFRPAARRTKRKDGTPRTVSRPRYMVKASDLQKYIDGLPPANDESLKTLNGVKARKPRRPAGIEKELAACVQYV